MNSPAGGRQAGHGKHRRLFVHRMAYFRFVCIRVCLSNDDDDGDDGIDDDEILISFDLYVRAMCRADGGWGGWQRMLLFFFCLLTSRFFQFRSISFQIMHFVYFTLIEVHKLVFPLQRVASIKFQFRNKARFALCSICALHGCLSENKLYFATFAAIARCEQPFSGCAPCTTIH